MDNSDNVKISVKFKAHEFWKFLHNTPEAFRLVWAASRSTTILGVSLTLVASFIPAASSWVAKLLIDSIVNATIIELSPAAAFRNITPILALEFGLVLLGLLVSQIRTLFDRTLQFKLTKHINCLIIQQANRLDLQFFEDPIFYDKLKNANRQADVSALNVVNATLSFIQQFIILLSLFVLLIRFSSALAVVVFLSAIPSFLSQSHFSDQIFRIVSKRAPRSRMLNYLEQILTGDTTVKEIKLFGLGKPLLNRYQSIFDEFYKEDRTIVKKRAIAGIGWGLLSSVVYYLGYGWIILRTVIGFITLGDMTMYQTIFIQSQRSIRTLLDNLNRLYENNMYLDNLFTYLKLEPKLVVSANGLIAPRPIRKGIEFRNVNFRYPGSQIDVLQDINLQIFPGEKIALVGMNGAGKTTLVKLLTRMYDPTGGQILLDGVDLREYDLSSLHKLFGVIFQDFVRYQFSVRENIGFGHVEDIDDIVRIQKAAEFGGVQEIINNMPHGYDTILGRRWENGHELSGGQWQKIALARAFMRNAELFVLDEPTSSLDAGAEYEIFTRFGKLIEGRSAVLISHRFSTVRTADRIVVLSNGMITEVGSHSELLKMDGTYSRLFNLQAIGYR